MNWRDIVGLTWRRHRALGIAFVIAGALTLFFLGRTIVFYTYWATHREVPIEDWMTVGYIARSYDIDRSHLRGMLGLEADEPDRRTLARIADDRGVPVTTLIDEIEAAIARAKAEAS
ncbi:hypothetical protein [Neoaquamicrobium sediminum]|uniref:Uncharacterized protein n=1 Tax=Neoaquamicrobium sediminum TaxID=1849104 RepID=A0ABV3WV08_9HYPH